MHRMLKSNPYNLKGKLHFMLGLTITLLTFLLWYIFWFSTFCRILEGLKSYTFFNTFSYFEHIHGVLSL